jgi:hypothetical protein
VQILDVLKEIKTPELRLAWLVAIFTDALQIGLTPMFAEGAFSPADTVLDVITATILVRLIGWHWAFLPSFFAELVPGFDLFPTWTAAVFYVTQKQVRSGEPEILPPEPVTR